MKIKIYGNNEDTNILLEKVNFSIEELGLGDFISAETTYDENLKNELNISKEPALIIEEESIEFKDMIFEGIIPEIDEIKSMFVSIIGGGEESGGGSCGTGGGCGTGCSC
ncbi:MAG: hypothetical protein NWP80_01405 [Candidatus Gracilibacteria bacterium]|nr:hypothetical protein [Candidatus Gracilibacteria bacterium]